MGEHISYFPNGRKKICGHCIPADSTFLTCTRIMGRKLGGKNSFHKPATAVIRIPELEKWAFEKMKGALKEDRGDSIDEAVYPDLKTALEKAKEYSFNSRRSVYIYSREFYYWISLICPDDIESYKKRLDAPKCGVVTILKNGKVVDQ